MIQKWILRLCINYETRAESSNLAQSEPAQVQNSLSEFVQYHTSLTWVCTTWTTFLEYTLKVQSDSLYQLYFDTVWVVLAL